MATLHCSAYSHTTFICPDQLRIHRSITRLCHKQASAFLMPPLSNPNILRSDRLTYKHPSAKAYSFSSRNSSEEEREEVFFDGGPHIGDLATNLVFGLSLVWLPLTLASVFRALFLRYRFTNLRVTVLSGLAGSERKDFSYNVIKDVKYVPRFIGEWGDVVITLSDGTQVELKSVPKFKEIARYCLDRVGSDRDRGDRKEERSFGPGKGITTRM